jgi:glycine dehydrogenase subunit 1
MFKYLPHTESEIKEMLKAIGVKKVDDLFFDVDSSLLNHDFDVPESLSEYELLNLFKGYSDENTLLKPLVGQGAFDHIAPTPIRHLIERQEFLTSYTPYQPEISQGTLQYIFEYQSIVCELTGLDVSNASLYDGPTATQEAMLMAMRINKKQSTVLVSETVYANTIDVLKTTAHFQEINIKFINENNGQTDMEHLSSLLDDDVAAVILQSPNKYGVIEDLETVKKLKEAQKALFILNSDLSSYSLLKPASEYGVDIAVGEAMSLGIGLSFGGPYIGYMATTKNHMRKMPGRICGITTDENNERAFVLTLQAREQHIRRDKANSNICSNQSLLSLYVTIYAALMGKVGMVEVQQSSVNATHYFAKSLNTLSDFELAFSNEYFKEVTFKTSKPIESIITNLEGHGYLGPFVHPNGLITFSLTEKWNKTQIDQLIHILEGL